MVDEGERVGVERGKGGSRGGEKKRGVRGRGGEGRGGVGAHLGFGEIGEPRSLRADRDRTIIEGCV